MNEIFTNKNENKLINKNSQYEKDDNFKNNIINVPEIISKNEIKNEEKNFDCIISLNEAKKRRLCEEKLVKSNKMNCTDSKEFDAYNFDEMIIKNNYNAEYSKYVNINNMKCNDKNYNSEDMRKKKNINSKKKLTVTNEQGYNICSDDLIKVQNIKNDFLKKTLISDYEKDSCLKNNQGLLNESINNFESDKNLINNYKDKKYSDKDKSLLFHESEKENNINTTNSININNSEKEMRYSNSKTVENYEEHKNNINNQSDSIKVDIFYSSKSEKSLGESDENSSYDSVEEFYENICQSDVPLDFYKNFLKTKNSNLLESDSYLDSKNDATEEINILNTYIKSVIETSQNSTSLDVDNKLINILSLSFLTFIDHVIYDSHIYALKDEFLKGEVIKSKSEDEVNCKEYEKVKDLYNFIPADRNKIKNKMNDSNEENNIINENTFNSKFQKSSTNSSIANCNDSKERHEKNSNMRESNNDVEKKRKNNISMIYNPDVINLCLTNLYSQKLVDKIMDKKKNNKEVSTFNNLVLSKNEDILTVDKKAENLKKYDSDLGNEKKVEKEILESENHIKEKNDEMKENINFNKNEKPQLTNSNDKLYQRKVIIKQINDKIKKNNNNMSKFLNYQKYSLEDLFEI
ncbi:conserved Plasmodium protein, unknown function [Plasmodium gallinaceum]|uniref:Uncharacterized protein n=1 Tax=Plasmodium gallinaceum TaxID=5849 RepID=A0A1J1GX55_PLAGA|nr:conserved Plasmodium protein, unknown function [Plasmodium gallinaceum]CRG97147.1 conserved Plasmodium protein, unknown function [Plasmodium gallinaceum]